MSRLEELQRELQEAGEAIARAERTVAAHPGIPSAAATLRTIMSWRDNVEAQFRTAADQIGLDICSYRIELDERTRPTIAGMTAVLGEFQRVFTSVFHALKNGPKLRGKVSAESTEATAFEFAYTFRGSIGVMMTLQNERLLSLTKTDLDEAMDRTLALLSVKDHKEIQAIAEVVGLPALRYAHQWAVENANAGFGADILWQRESAVRQSARLQPAQIRSLASAIQSATAKEETTVIGDLVDVDFTAKTFGLALKDRTISGTFNNAISQSHPVVLPSRYQAVLRVIQRVVVEAGQEEKSYLLLRLEPADPSIALLSDFSSDPD